MSSQAKPWEAILISTLAGACTILGGLSLFLVRSFKPIPFSICLALAGGVMTYVTMVELIPGSIDGCAEALIELENTRENPRSEDIMEAYGWLLATSCVFFGYFLAWGFSAALDACMEKCHLVGHVNFDENGNLIKETEAPTTTPRGNASLERSDSSSENVHAEQEEEVVAPVSCFPGQLEIITKEHLDEFRDEDGNWDGEMALNDLIADERGCSRFLMKLKRNVDESQFIAAKLASATFRRDQSKFLRIGLFTALALGMHNIPEGMATYTSYMEDKNFGYGMAFAIAVHNIPEGIAVAVPVYFATGSWVRALSLCAISAVAEPIGACFAWGIQNMTDSPIADGILFGVIAGFMLRVSIAELLVTALKYDPINFVTIKSTFLGMVIMGYSLTLFQFTGE